MVRDWSRRQPTSSTSPARSARFFFHPTQGTDSGTVTAEELREREADFAAVDGIAVGIYRDRTTLPPDEIARFGGT